jgi:hypothetical protein
MRFREAVCLLALGISAAFAQHNSGTGAEQSPIEPTVEPLSAAVHKCWTSGSGTTYFQACVSKHGNVVQLKSPANIENIRLGAIGEGYVACASNTSGGPATTYYDAGSTEAGWAEPYKITAAPVISRKTLDGKLELVQSFASDAAEKDLTVTMTLYNRSNATLYNVRLDRYADFDTDSHPAGDVFHKSPRAVFAWDKTTSLNLVSMTELTPAVYTTSVHSWTGWQKSVCNQATSPSPTSPGDGIGRISYDFGTMAKGTSKTVKLLYKVQ